ncbi:MAG: hypothetical protein ABSH42_02465 [Bryobacteraceae bacterium]
MRRSLRSLRQVSPNMPVAVFTDHAAPAMDIPDLQARQLPKGAEPFSAKRMKISAFLATPFEKTLFIDSDTHICGDLTTLFDILDRFDVCAALDPGLWNPKCVDGDVQKSGFEVPAAFVEHNTGLVGFRSTPGVMEFLRKWRDYHALGISHGISADQPSFRKCLYESDLRVATLPSEYNLRTPFIGAVFGRVILIHGRLDSTHLAERFNERTNSTRLYVPGIGVIGRPRNPFLKVINRMRLSRANRLECGTPGTLSRNRGKHVAPEPLEEAVLSFR